MVQKLILCFRQRTFVARGVALLMFDGIMYRDKYANFT